MTSADGEMRAENLGELLDQVSKNSTGEIDSLICEFQRLREKLQIDGERIKRRPPPDDGDGASKRRVMLAALTPQPSNSDFPHGSYSMIPSILVPLLSCLELLRINSHHLD